jgi:hypothetical protein
MGMEGFNPIPPQEETENLVQPEQLTPLEPVTPIEIVKEASVKKETVVEVNESLKKSGSDFTSSLGLMNGRLSRIDKEAEIVSPGTIGKLRTATRSLEDSFQREKLDLNETATSFNRLTASFEDLSLIQDRELRKVTDDARKSLVFAIEGTTDSARVLRMDESIVELRKNINMMIDKADAAAQRLRRGIR